MSQLGSWRHTSGAVEERERRERATEILYFGRLGSRLASDGIVPSIVSDCRSDTNAKYLLNLDVQGSALESLLRNSLSINTLSNTRIVSCIEDVRPKQLHNECTK